jgi:hypothetical protein
MKKKKENEIQIIAKLSFRHNIYSKSEGMYYFELQVKSLSKRKGNNV